MNTIYVYGLPFATSEEDIREWLRADGFVTDQVRVIRHRETQESKGFCFIDATDADEMAAIIARLDGALIAGRVLRATRARNPTRTWRAA